MKRSNLRWLVCGLAVAGLLAWFGYRTLRTAVENPLPPLGDVQSVTASYFDPDSKQEVEFAVPLDRLPAVYAALQPATLDWSPAKWMVLGDLEFSLRDGRPFRVDFYWLKGLDEPGAFSAGETHERRSYYRGGSSSRLLDALRKAHEAASD